MKQMGLRHKFIYLYPTKVSWLKENNDSAIKEVNKIRNWLIEHYKELV